MLQHEKYTKRHSVRRTLSLLSIALLVCTLLLLAGAGAEEITDPLLGSPVNTTENSLTNAAGVLPTETAIVGMTTPIVRAGTDSKAPFNIRTARKITQAEREEAAERFRALVARTRTAPVTTSEDLATSAAIPAVAMDPGSVPHYMGPYPNYANNPMPKGGIGNITLATGGTGYSAPVVSITDVYGTGSGATATAAVTGGVITSIILTNPGTGYTAPLITINDATGTGAAATATIGGPLTGGIRKFVDSLPGLNAAGANNLGQYIPVAIPDTTSYPAGGAGYTSLPTIIIADETGTGAVAIPTVSGGRVIGVSITNRGSGYSPKPQISFSGGGATTQAIGKATVVNGAITGIVL